MVTNIIEAIQQRLGYQPLKKVDPNTQETAGKNEELPEQRLAQAAIPSVLAAMIKYSDSPDGLNLLRPGEDSNPLGTIYCGQEDAAIRTIADYSGATPDNVRLEMTAISNEAIKVVRESVKTPDAESLRSFMNSQRHSILSHLPASMKMGDVLNENTFDDRTNKMEGPISTFLHKIEDII
jgi:hypothetical protein